MTPPSAAYNPSIASWAAYRSNPTPDDMVIALEALTRIASDAPFGLPGDDELLARRHYARDVIATLRRGVAQ